MSVHAHNSSPCGVEAGGLGVWGQPGPQMWDHFKQTKQNAGLGGSFETRHSAKLKQAIKSMLYDLKTIYPSHTAQKQSLPQLGVCDTMYSLWEWHGFLTFCSRHILNFSSFLIFVHHGLFKTSWWCPGVFRGILLWVVNVTAYRLVTLRIF